MRLLGVFMATFGFVAAACVLTAGALCEWRSATAAALVWMVVGAAGVAMLAARPGDDVLHADDSPLNRDRADAGSRLPRLWQGPAHAAAAVGITAGVIIVLTIITGATIGQARDTRARSTCLSNIRQIATGILMYTEDYAGAFPPGDRWNQALAPYAGIGSVGFSDAQRVASDDSSSVYRCPAADSNLPSYAMNSLLPRIRSIDSLSRGDQLITIFESVPGENLLGGAALLPSPARHAGNNVGYADGHARTSRGTAAEALAWTPTTASR